MRNNKKKYIIVIKKEEETSKIKELDMREFVAKLRKKE